MQIKMVQIKASLLLFSLIEISLRSNVDHNVDFTAKETLHSNEKSAMNHS